MSYPSHLVQSDDWRVKERFQQLQDHLKRRVAFGFQNHHDRLRGISSAQNHHLRRIRMVTKSAVSKLIPITTLFHLPPSEYQHYQEQTVLLNGTCGTLCQSTSTETHAMIEILKHYLVDKLMMEVRHFELLQTPFRLRRIPWEHVLLQQQVYLRKWSMYSPSSSLNMAHNQISSALPPKVNKMLDPRNTFAAQRNNLRSGAMRSVYDQRESAKVCTSLCYKGNRTFSVKTWHCINHIGGGGNHLTLFANNLKAVLKKREGGNSQALSFPQ